MKKPWYKSKTLWFNLLVGAGVAAEANIQAFHQLVGEQFYPLLLVAVPAVNAALRFVTTQGLGKDDEESKA